MFEELHLLLSNLVVSDSWEAQDLPPAYPDDYFLSIADENYLKFGLASSDRRKISYDTPKQVTGVLLYSVFYQKTGGKKYASQVADKLSLVVDDKLFLDGKVQTFTGSLVFLGNDPQDSTLARADYSVPFNFIGE